MSQPKIKITLASLNALSDNKYYKGLEIFPSNSFIIRRKFPVQSSTVTRRIQIVLIVNSDTHHMWLIQIGRTTVCSTLILQYTCEYICVCVFHVFRNQTKELWVSDRLSKYEGDGEGEEGVQYSMLAIAQSETIRAEYSRIVCTSENRRERLAMNHPTILFISLVTMCQIQHASLPRGLSK